MRLFRPGVLFTVTLFSLAICSAQNVGIGTTTPAPGAILDIVSSDKGVLIPRVETSAVTTPVAGLLVYQPSDHHFYYYNGTAWQSLGGDSVIDADGDTRVTAFDGPATLDTIKFHIDGVRMLRLRRNSLGDLMLDIRENGTGNLFVGSQAGKAISHFSGVEGYFNVGVGGDALTNTTFGTANTAMGFSALAENTNGSYNTAVGEVALTHTSTGSYNTAIGDAALFYNSANSRSTALGAHALLNADDRTTGRPTYNTAIGYRALFGSPTPSANTGQHNTAVGDNAMAGTTSGERNTGIGSAVMEYNMEGSRNCAIGYGTLNLNTSGSDNSAGGYLSLLQNTTGSDNTGFGAYTLRSNTTTSSNTALGSWALNSNRGDHNTAVGKDAMPIKSFGNNNTVVGRSAMHLKSAGNNNVAFGDSTGFNNTTGNANVFLGHAAGFYETGSSRLYVDNSKADANNALLYGEFDKDYLQANASVQVRSDSASTHALYSRKTSPPGTFQDVAGVYGENTVDDFYGYGVYGKGGYIGVRGDVVGTGGSTHVYYGLYGTATGSTSGTNYAVYGYATGGARNYAGYFQGDAFVSANLGIGTTNFATGYRLSVDGKIACEEVLVDMSGDWPDYVFAPEYELESLDGIRSFIKEHGHLPNIPSAREVKAEGIELGDMNARLLEKIEELTLHILAQDERIAALENSIQSNK